MALLILISSQSALAKGFSVSVSLSVSGTVTSISDSISKAASTVMTLVQETHGPYEVTDITVAENRDDQMRLTLKAQGDDARPDLYLYVSGRDYANVNLGVGQIVDAAQKPYGLAFYQHYDKHPFVVVLNDEWMSDLPARQVALQ